jgi:hypothetical protein
MGNAGIPNPSHESAKSHGMPPPGISLPKTPNGDFSRRIPRQRWDSRSRDVGVRDPMGIPESHSAGPEIPIVPSFGILRDFCQRMSNRVDLNARRKSVSREFRRPEKCFARGGGPPANVRPQNSIDGGISQVKTPTVPGIWESQIPDGTWDPWILRWSPQKIGCVIQDSGNEPYQRDFWPLEP